MKALITGAKGFVGPYLKQYLESQNYEVISTDKDDLDILDRDKVFQFINKHKFTHIFHLAGFSSPRLSHDNAELCHNINVNGTKNLLDAVIYSNTKPKILIVSSAHVYGKPKYLPIDEQHPLDPTTSPYAKSRIEQEKITKNYKLPIIISRSFNHTGPGRQDIFICSEFAKKIAEIESGKREPVIEVMDLTAKRDFTDVRDMVKAYYLALEKAQPNQTYNLCSGKAYSAQDILDILLKLTQKEIKIIEKQKEKQEIDGNQDNIQDKKETPKQKQHNHIQTLQGTHNKFTQQTGWEPEIEFTQTLKDILEYWKEKIKK
tara:strand:+ start:3096 stop:4046 length:951 start_codon:yes stop_codon:yes gene_type:complete